MTLISEGFLFKQRRGHICLPEYALPVPPPPNRQPYPREYHRARRDLGANIQNIPIRTICGENSKHAQCGKMVFVQIRTLTPPAADQASLFRTGEHANTCSAQKIVTPR
jgi:hypothetical protein